MTDLAFMTTPPQKFSYALCGCCCLRPPFRLLLTMALNRQEGRIFFLIGLESDFSTCMF